MATRFVQNYINQMLAEQVPTGTITSMASDELKREEERIKRLSMRDRADRNMANDPFRMYPPPGNKYHGTKTKDLSDTSETRPGNMEIYFDRYYRSGGEMYPRGKTERAAGRSRSDYLDKVKERKASGAPMPDMDMMHTTLYGGPNYGGKYDVSAKEQKARARNQSDYMLGNKQVPRTAFVDENPYTAARHPGHRQRQGHAPYYRTPAFQKAAEKEKQELESAKAIRTERGNDRKNWGTFDPAVIFPPSDDQLERRKNRKK
jgi:hypothetical protein